MPIFQKVMSAWNAFRQGEPSLTTDYGLGVTSYSSAPPARTRRSFNNEKTIISSIYTRLGIDVASVQLLHIETDKYGRYNELKNSELNVCLNVAPNLDQGPRQFRQDIAQTLFDKGVAAIVPVDSILDQDSGEIVDIYTLRVGEVVAWYPSHVKVNLYNEKTGNREDVVLEKRMVAIVENPLYSVMNEQNSTLKRLIRKLGLLDTVDEASSSGKLDIIIQLPYQVRSEAMKTRAETRRKEIEFQLKGSQYGIAYADGTEKITQLNRPAENNLLTQIQYLTSQLYSQLGLTEDIMLGVADEKTMINYFNRTVEPIADAIAEAMQKTFIADRARDNTERITYFKDPFKFLPLSQLAEVVDKFTRNEVATANELRGKMGLPPSKEPKADLLVNSNMPMKDTQVNTVQPPAPVQA